ncbi:MAG TPA: acyltransferase [Terriglobales bacterium]|nr:acyltransferase [Terriglobales bacterium]
MAADSPCAVPVSTPGWSARVPALDGLRGLAIALVLLRHAVFGVSSVEGIESHSPIISTLIACGQLTWSGVDLFFVLSGFLIGGILLDVRNSPRYYETFYIRRAYRILPLYYVVIGLSLLPRLLAELSLGRAAHITPLPFPWWAYATFTQNFWMAHAGLFGPSGIGITWSLAIEAQFYLTIPLVIRKIRARNLVMVLLVVAACAPWLRVLLHSSMAYPGLASYVLTPTRADALTLGVLTALLVRIPVFWNSLQSHQPTLWSVTVLFFLGIAYMTWQRYDALSYPMTTWGFSWLAAFYTCVLLIVISSADGAVSRILQNHWLRRLGAIAYCSYLVHVAFMNAIRHPLKAYFPQYPVAAWLMGGIVGTALTLTVASLSNKYFEKPLLKRAHEHSY